MIRKLDDVGRIVIPKEIRKYLRLKDGSPLEIGINELGEVVLKASGKNTDVVGKLTFVLAELHKYLQKNVLLINYSGVVASFGCDICGEISDELLRIMEDSRVYFACVYDNTTLIPILKDNEIFYKSIVISPIIVEDEKYCIITYGNEDKVDMNEALLLEFVTKLIKGLIE